jgi:DNA (cytosine-5)-methyltransferase 1
MRPVVVDYFCGAGGFTCGALDAGAAVACGVDCDDRLRRTYEQTGVQLIASTVEELRPKIIDHHLAGLSGPLVFVGCPPCQPFSRLGDGGRPEDRDAMIHFLDHVREFLPDYVVVENVPSIRNTSTWDRALSRLHRYGYRTRHDVVNSASYGVPQTRRRALLIACRSALGCPPWPDETHQPADYWSGRAHRTVRDAIGGLPPIAAGETCSADPLHRASRLSALNLRRIMALPPGGSRREWPRDLRLQCHRGHDGHSDAYGRMDWDKPSPTLTTRYNGFSNGRFGHPDQHRAISLREGALLQSFPAGYHFGGGLEASAQQIGNAVPPRLAKAIIEAISC